MGKRVNPMAVKSALTYEVSEAAAVLGVTPATIRNWIKDGLPVMTSQKPYLISGSDLREYLRQKYKAVKSPLDWNELYCTSCSVGRTPRDMAATIDAITAKTSLIKGCCSQCSSTATRMIATAKAPEWAEVFHFTKGDHSEAYKTPPLPPQNDSSEGETPNA